jgi:hypothetical protein
MTAIPAAITAHTHGGAALGTSGSARCRRRMSPRPFAGTWKASAYGSVPHEEGGQPHAPAATGR